MSSLIDSLEPPRLRGSLDFISFEERIRRRAQQLYQQRGNAPGSALTDWLRAEEEMVGFREAAIDEASEESFPASDPPAR